MSVQTLRDHSLFRLVSLGYVAENKLRTSSEIEVTMTEIHPFVNGELRANVETKTASGVDARGNAFNVTVHMANTIKATWKGDGTNRITPPDVRRGDPVEIWQYGEVNKYYWVVRDDPSKKNVRKLETVITTFSNTRDENDNEPNAKNSWYSEVNTHDKVWTLLQTNRNDGEPFAYSVQVDAKTGTLVLADDDGNFVQINSKEQHIELINSYGSEFHLKKGKVLVICEDFEVQASNSIKTTTKTATHETVSTNYKSSSWSVQVPTTTWQGNITQSGNFSGAGGSMTYTGTSVFNGSTTLNGNATISSNLSVGGSGTFGGNVSASNI